LPAQKLAAAFAGCLAGLALVASTAAAAGGGNSSAAKVCQKDGYSNLVSGSGSGFSNQGDCVRYAAQGGSFGVAAPFLTLTPFSSGILAIDGGGLEPGAPVSVCNGALGAGCIDSGTNVSGDGTYVGTISCSPGEYLESTSASGAVIDSNPAGAC
jgi:hypothetical protein